MKHPAFILCALLPLSAATPSQALVNLGEGRLNLTASASVFHDTAILARNSGQEDTIYTAGTGLTYTRPSRSFDFSAAVQLTIQRYAEFTDNDDENISLNVNFSPSQRLETSRFTITGDLILSTSTEANEEVGDIVTTRNYGLSLGVFYDPNRRYNLRLSASAVREDPDSDIYNETDRYNLGLTVEVPVKEDAFLEFGGSYNKSESDESVQSVGDTYTVFAGLSGQLLPKVGGFIRLGAQFLETEGLGSDEAPYASAGLNWLIDDSTSASIQLTREFGSTIDDRSSETTSGSISFNRELNRRMSANAGLRYIDSKYKGAAALGNRTDERIEVFSGLAYELTRNSSLSFSASYRDTSSSDSAFEYDQWRIGATVSVGW